MIKSKQRMDFNMTSNHQKNIPPKKTDSEPSKATESKSAKAPGTASPKEADARSSAKPHRRRAYLDGMDSWTISGKHKTVTINTRAVDMPVNCQKKSGKNNPPRWRQPELRSSC